MSGPLSVLVVDDEAIARRGIRGQVERLFPGARTSEARNGAEALASIASSAPDVMLLDIEMPGLSAFDVLRRLPSDTPTRVVFVTAYDDFALDAFDAGAVDYVLKPVDPTRLQRAIHRALSRGPATGEATGDPGPLVVRIAGRTRLVPLAEVEWIEAAGSYVKLHTATEEILHRASLTALVESLGPAAFVRVHRSSAASVSAIREVRPTGRGDATLVLQSGAEVSLSRRYRAALMAALSLGSA